MIRETEKNFCQTKVLFLHSNQSNYLAETLFHGLRKLLGSNCVDVPRYDSMYAPMTDGIQSKLRGYGFTLYGLLEEIPSLAESRYFWHKDLDNYDIIVVADICNQWDLLWQLSTIVSPEKLAILDGQDTPAFFPFVSLGWRLKNYPWTYLTPTSKTRYFKRELMPEGAAYSLDRFLPRWLRKWIPIPNNAIPIGFSIPEEKIWRTGIESKTKQFPTHIVDLEVASYLDGAFFSATGSDKHTFTSEKEYYEDLSKARFGITTKRAGWDCLRHYELAANGCVLCFRDLDLKPATCAPHGLNESNCIIYHSYTELMERINTITEDEYQKLYTATFKWIESNTTTRRARQFLEVYFSA
ncbi:glycosyltransferase family 1 protein [Leptolyngbya sp. FACHB-261]|uniref:glycosyltransferase family 1 protein n=1 Tax=Leptolyngbya sp. FACHB-261 TaxID=2692806 RepID=UPI0016869DF8|nr:glycosyltransferase family 1 protein [Leptolyngbya sp. FACHB-261]MBD2099621.1 glycosyltransferase family 1 protein [Leptolyngbya sp. FACHB-261]